MTTATTQRKPGLLGQTVVVIGGSSGMGLETARLARAEGAGVVITGRTPEHIERAAAELGEARTVAFDATDPAALERFFGDLPDPVDHARRSGGRRPPVERGPHGLAGVARLGVAPLVAEGADDVQPAAGLAQQT